MIYLLEIFMKNSAKALVVSVIGASFVFSGCQAVTDQIGQKIAETAIENASGGQVKIDSNSGKLNIKTEKGDVSMDVNNTKDGITINSSEGSLNFSGGDTRPANVPSDLPNVEGATGFQWYGTNEGGGLSYTLATADFKDVCGKQGALLTAAGWVAKQDVSMSYGTTMVQGYEKGGDAVTATCLGNTEEAKTTVMLSKAKNQ